MGRGRRGLAPPPPRRRSPRGKSRVGTRGRAEGRCGARDSWAAAALRRACARRQERGGGRGARMRGGAGVGPAARHVRAAGEEGAAAGSGSQQRDREGSLVPQPPAAAAGACPSGLADLLRSSGFLRSFPAWRVLLKREQGRTRQEFHLQTPSQARAGGERWCWHPARDRRWLVLRPRSPRQRALGADGATGGVGRRSGRPAEGGAREAEPR